MMMLKPQQRWHNMNLKLKKILESVVPVDEELPELTPEEKQQALTLIREYNKLGAAIDRNGDLEITAKALAKIAEVASRIINSEGGASFDKKTVADNMKRLTASSKEFNKVVEDAKSLDQRMTALYEDMGNLLERYFDIEDIEDVDELGLGA